MTTITPPADRGPQGEHREIADLKASIAKKYMVVDDYVWFVADAKTGDPVTSRDHDNALDAEAEMEAIIQDEVKAAMEEME